MSRNDKNEKEIMNRKKKVVAEDKSRLSVDWDAMFRFFTYLEAMIQMSRDIVDSIKDENNRIERMNDSSGGIKMNRIESNKNEIKKYKNGIKTLEDSQKFILDMYYELTGKETVWFTEDEFNEGVSNWMDLFYHKGFREDLVDRRG